MRLLQRLPQFLFFGAIALSLIVIGMALAQSKLPPYPQVRDAVKTGAALWSAAFPPDYFGALANRSNQPVEDFSHWPVADATDQTPYWIIGGLNQFLNQCPAPGCLAVQITKSGEVLKSVPYRPSDIIAASRPDVAQPYEHMGFDPLTNTRPVGLEIYADGDLLVTFQANGAVFPYGTGVARIAPDGTPRWFRFAYAHHWPTLLDDGTALVPALRISDEHEAVHLATGLPELVCDANAQMIDVIRHIGPDGELLEEIDLFDKLINSPFAQYIMNTSDPCDWLHLNRIEQLKGPLGGDLNEGDLVLSLRNINALAVMDGQTREIKNLVRGNFLQQHAVQQLNGPNVVLFDNWGGADGASEVMIVNLLTGAERVLFPNPDTPEALSTLYSSRAGYIGISPDNSRLIAAYTHAGLGVEMDASTGEVLAVYDHLHDISDVDDVPEPATRFAVRYDLFSMLY